MFVHGKSFQPDDCIIKLITVFYRVQCTYEYSKHLNFTMIFSKKLFLFVKNNFTGINHCKFIHHKSHLKTFLSHLPCTVRREYFSIIFSVKKYTLYSINTVNTFSKNILHIPKLYQYLKPSLHVWFCSAFWAMKMYWTPLLSLRCVFRCHRIQNAI